jgi:hypothetical protein
MMKYRSYVKCKRCGFLVQLPFECRVHYPLHFVVECPRCKRRELYHRLEVLQEDDEYCKKEEERAEKAVEPLRTVFNIALWSSMMHSLFQTLMKAIGGAKIGGNKIKRDRAGFTNPRTPKI